MSDDWLDIIQASEQRLKQAEILDAKSETKLEAMTARLVHIEGQFAGAHGLHEQLGGLRNELKSAILRFSSGNEILAASQLTADTAAYDLRRRVRSLEETLVLGSKDLPSIVDKLAAVFNELEDLRQLYAGSQLEIARLRKKLDELSAEPAGRRVPTDGRSQ
jgi:chromosome segregation ATPase